MKISIFWATGGIDKQTVKHAKLKGYEVAEFMRNTSKIQDKEINTIQIPGKDEVIWCVGIAMENYEKRIIRNFNG